MRWGIEVLGRLIGAGRMAGEQGEYYPAGGNFAKAAPARAL